LGKRLPAREGKQPYELRRALGASERGAGLPMCLVLVGRAADDGFEVSHHDRQQFVEILRDAADAASRYPVDVRKQQFDLFEDLVGMLDSDVERTCDPLVRRPRHDSAADWSRTWLRRPWRP